MKILNYLGNGREQLAIFLTANRLQGHVITRNNEKKHILDINFKVHKTITLP